MDLSLEKLKEAVSLREQIHSLEQRLSSIFGSGSVSGSESSTSGGSAKRAAKSDGRRRRRAMSSATREKLASAARARWARERGSDTSASSDAPKAVKSSKRKGGITAAGRKKLSDAMRARWAARRDGAGAKKK